MSSQDLVDLMSDEECVESLPALYEAFFRAMLDLRLETDGVEKDLGVEELSPQDWEDYPLLDDLLKEMNRLDEVIGIICWRTGEYPRTLEEIAHEPGEE